MRQPLPLSLYEVVYQELDKPTTSQLILAANFSVAVEEALSFVESQKNRYGFGIESVTLKERTVLLPSRYGA